MQVRGMVTWCRDPLGYGFRSQNNGPEGVVHYSNITGEGFPTLKEVTALVTIKQLARQA
jgi:cold shock CspA family protein